MYCGPVFVSGSDPYEIAVLKRQQGGCARSVLDGPEYQEPPKDRFASGC